MNQKRKTFVRVTAIVLAVILTVSLLAGALAATVHAASSAEIQEQIDDLEDASDLLAQRREELQKEIEENTEEGTNLLAEKQLLDRQMTLLLQEIDNVNQKIDRYEYLIAEKETELDQAEEAEDLLQAQYKERIRALEENGTVTYLSVLFKASSFSDLLDRLDMIRDINESDKEMMETLAAASETIRTARTSLDDARQKLDEERKVLAEKEAELIHQGEELLNLLERYEQAGILLQDLCDEYEQRQADILLEIARNQEAYRVAVEEEEAARLAEEEERKRQEEERKRQEEEQKRQEEEQGDAGSSNLPSDIPGSTGEYVEPEPEPAPESKPEPDKELPSDIPGSTGEYVEPEPEPVKPRFMVPLTSYVLTDIYGVRIHPIYGTEKFHYGIDMSAPEWTPIYATASGTVVVATEDPEGICGNYVMIAHSGDYMSSYLHMVSYCVSQGQYVQQGQVIGYVGSTGLSTGPHLHFAMYYKGSFVDPMNYIG